jgi:hypothetical protein
MPTASPPPAAPEPQEPQQSAADRLLRAQAAELEALRAQVKDLPDPDTLLAWRGKAEQFDALAADLPAWREQLQAAHQQERRQLQQQLQSRDAELQQQQQQHQLQTLFLQAGGNPLHFSAWLELYGSKFVQRTEDGQLVSNENGQIMPIADVLSAQSNDALYGVLFHPRYGAGSGGRMGKDARVTTVPDLNKMKTGEIFREAFAKGSR